MRTRPPGRAPVSARTPPPVEFSGSQTTRSGISVIRSGSSTEPAGPVTARTSPSFTPVSAAVAAESRAIGRVPGAGQGLVALLEPALVEQEPVAREDRLARRPGRGSGARSPRTVGGALPGPRAEPVELPAYGVHVGQRESARPARRPACAARGRRSGASRAGHLLGLERGLERPRPALPVEERAGLLGDRGDREDHVGVVGDLARAAVPGRPRSRLVERRPARGPGPAGPRARRPRPAGRPVRRWRRPRRSGRCRGRSGAGVRPRPRRRPTSSRARGSVAGRPPGSSDGQRARLDRAALAGPARDPHQLRRRSRPRPVRRRSARRARRRAARRRR